ncbi:unnamed protein product [Staurois parvus]|uniref:Uncharacterized protein n=1 Tax=Staurois parvus TaxID=386267 RepID=A0ABN9ABU5_9NEOB|nr:unnamed protein product [Staurois parvus]
MSLFYIFEFPASSIPHTSRNGTWNTDAGIGWRRWPGTLQGGHRGSAGQGKCWRDPGATLQSNPECSSGLTLLVLKVNPELHLGIPPGGLKLKSIV